MAVDDIARLGLEVNTKDIKDAIKRLDDLEKQGGKTEKTTRRMTGSFSAMGGAIAALGVGVLAHQIISANAEFSKLHGALTTVTGSADAANDVVERMKELMAVVPGDLNELTNSFIKLKALGLDPSEEAMISYSNTAAAMGKDLNQMIEAVADAATGEFERLKEFGIKAASEGDRVKFTFQGVTKEVGKNSQEIQDYLLAIGNTQFAGAAAKQMDTFGGALDNVGSQLSALMIADDGLPGATAALKELADVISDPNTKAGMDSLIAGVAQLVQWAAQGATAFVDFGQGIGEFAGKVYTGVNIIDQHVAATKSLTQRIEDQKSVFESAGIVQKNAVQNYNDISASLASLNEKYPESTETIASLTEQQSKAAEQVRLTTQALESERESLDRLTKAKEAQPSPEDASGGGGTVGLTDAEKDALKDKLKTLQSHYASDTEAALAALIEKQTLITELEEANIGSEDERRELRLEATQEYENALLEITQNRLDEEQAAKDKAAAEDEKRNRLTNSVAIALMRDGGKNASKILKDFAKEQAQMYVYKSVLSAFADTPGPIWVKAGAAAAAGIFAGQLVDKMLGGGGGGGGGGAAAPTAATGGGDEGGAAPRGLEAPEQSTRNVQIADISKMPDDAMVTKRGLADILGQLVEQNVIQGVRT